jgi:hypothetical protein
MSRERVPEQYQPALVFFKWLVLAVTLGPLFLCAGCIGLGAVLSFFSQPSGPPPPPARTTPAPRETPASAACAQPGRPTRDAPSPS